MPKKKPSPATSLGGALQTLEIHKNAFCNLRMLETAVQIAERGGHDAARIVQLVKEAFAEYDAATKPEHSLQGRRVSQRLNPDRAREVDVTHLLRS